jgi:predicted enzyme related to lactoylglutathione lyase
MHGQFVWYELMTTDAAAAKKFYPPVTGWGIQKWDDPSLDYSMWTAGGVPIAGVLDLTPEQRAQGIPANWLPYVAVDSVDGTTAKATSLGGKVVIAPFDIPGVGRMAVLQDPQGATIALLRGTGNEYKFDGTAKLGHMSWHELSTSDWKAAFNFYSALFGWQKQQEMDMGGGNMYVIFGHGSKQYGGMFNTNPEWGNMPPNWLPYANVRDIKAAEAAIKRGGAKIMNGPMEVPDGSWIIMGADPQGAIFAVHMVSPKAAAKAASNAGKKAKPAKKSKSKPKKKDKKKAKKAAKKAKKAAKKAKKKAKKKKKR